MCKVICFANQKGGVGKTTSCVNVASALVSQRQRVLLVDLDPQGNATMGSGVNKTEVEFSVNDVLLGTIGIKKAIVKATPAGYDLLPANADLTCAEVGLLKKHHREQVFKKYLQQVNSNYDFILCDCPPSLNMLTLNALVAATSVVIPMQCEYYALEGLSALIGTMQQVQSSLNPSLAIEGIVRTMYDPRNRLAQDVSKQLLQHFPKKVFKTIIPRNVRLAEAPSHGLPILMYDKGSRGASAYLSLAGEIIRKNSKAKTVARSRKQREEAI